MKQKLLLLFVMLASVVGMRGQSEPKAYAAYPWWGGNTLFFYYDEWYSERAEWMNETIFLINDNNEYPEWYGDNIGYIETIVFDASFATVKPTSTKNWFNGMTELTSIRDIQNLNTQDVTDMSGMFAGCSSLSRLDLRIFDTQKTTNMSGMFSGCTSLTSLLLSSSMANSLNNLSPDAFDGVGSDTNPCLIKQPDNFDFTMDTSGDYFVWQSGYFKLAEKIIKAYVVRSDNTLTFYCDDNSDFQEGTIYGFNYISPDISVPLKLGRVKY